MAEHASIPKANPMLSICDVTKRFGSVEVLRGISLEVASGEFLTILGESGSGKTTLLRLLAGFEQPTSGEIWMAGERIDPLPPNRRSLNTVFQSYALFPHLSVSKTLPMARASADCQNPKFAHSSRKPWRKQASGKSLPILPPESVVGSSNASLLPAPSSIARRFSSSMSRSPHSTPIFDARCRVS